MTKKQASMLSHGCYRLYWKSGDDSIASVGSRANGDRWFMPTNWIDHKNSIRWDLVDTVKLVRT